ncbi:MAG: hypothetical protein JWN21_2627 [Sphingomonas bacterium]|uniref:hypothetical protein n=1 Tax=Sphingomonas bacterium TaxID=1895847 RepID=UPI002601CAEB|nr:hypothetical protein [Sphingomonas bacterium]MDB5697084.1 hypothetical protein [Sphingomonas bacterium]
MNVISRALVGSVLLLVPAAAQANDYREKGKVAQVAGKAMAVTPPRDWNKLSGKPGKYAETWTLDGEQLNDVTFFGGVEPGQPLIRERSKKHEPLPKFGATTLLVEVPELLAGTYRAASKSGVFQVVGSKPDPFLGQPGILFNYEYTDEDGLPRKGEARAATIAGKLFMVTFDAPRLHYYDRTLGDFRSLTQTIKLAK